MVCHSALEGGPAFVFQSFQGEEGAGSLTRKVINCPCGRKWPQTLLFLSGEGTKARSHKGMGRGRESSPGDQLR